MRDANEFKKTKLDQLHALCRAKGLPLTVQRTVIMDALAARTDHPTADEIYEEVKPLLTGVSRTTVYRVLEAFVAHGLVQKIGSSAAKAHFDADVARHHHLECIRCGAISDIPHCEAYDIPLPSSEGNRHQVLDYAIHFRGVCARCRFAGQDPPEESA
ncbi:transcriptional repressor [Geotalea sp. SG265]|uniref:Fur family transcriptional regulator n=1 Tax=Geotalea sp. SG265 TaxID=2922867 RepID=UPI001FAF1C0C|nr:transcriptional repressor [Geotalea sp. SG265]